MQHARTLGHTELPGGPIVVVFWPRRDVAQITLLGEHDLASTPTLERSVNEALDQASHLLIDLGETEFIDSTTVHTLVRAARRAELLGVRFNVLVGAQTPVTRALEVAGLLGTLNAVESLEDAIAHNPIGDGHSNALLPRLRR